MGSSQEKRLVARARPETETSASSRAHVVKHVVSTVTCRIFLLKYICEWEDIYSWTSGESKLSKAESVLNRNFHHCRNKRTPTFCNQILEILNESCTPNIWEEVPFNLVIRTGGQGRVAWSPVSLVGFDLSASGSGGGAGGPGPLAPKMFSTSCSFQAILREKTLILGSGHPWGQNSFGAPLTKILDPPHQCLHTTISTLLVETNTSKQGDVAS